LTRARVLVTCPPALASSGSYIDRLGAEGLELVLPDVVQQLTEDELIALIGDVDGIIAGDDPLTAKVLKRAPRLRVLVRWGVGMDNVDLETAAALGIRVVNTPGMFGEDVADVAIGYLVLLARQLHHIDEAVRAGTWSKPQGRSLAGRGMGILGLGTIGLAVARRGRAMRMKVIGSDVDSAASERAAAEGLLIEPFNTLLAQSDVLVLCASLTPANRHLIDDDALRRMPRGGWLINVSRGSLVDERALADALSSGQLSGAALDVFEKEPLPIESPLRKLDQVIFGSHNASNTLEAVERVNDLAIDHLLRGLSEVRR
jgi:phosphoglycerate dehydrogenase-like enzyme